MIESRELMAYTRINYLIQARLIRKIRRNGCKRAVALFVQDELFHKLATLFRKFPLFISN
jgi:hypothetical protein